MWRAHSRPELQPTTHRQPPPCPLPPVNHTQHTRTCDGLLPALQALLGDAIVRQHAPPARGFGGGLGLGLGVTKGKGGICTMQGAHRHAHKQVIMMMMMQTGGRCKADCGHNKTRHSTANTHTDSNNNNNQKAAQLLTSHRGWLCAGRRGKPQRL